MKFKLKQKLFLYISLAFTAFSFCLFLLEQSRERKFKTEAIELRLSTYADIIYKHIINTQSEQYQKSINNIKFLFPSNLRISIINNQGSILYDNFASNISQLENHLNRPEIIKAQKNKYGSDIRVSITTKNKYLYYVQKKGELFIRVALPYDVQVLKFFQSDNVFLYITIVLFIIILIVLNSIINVFSTPIRNLRNFALNPQPNNNINFPKNEIGEIASEIASNYLEISKINKKIKIEKDKLLQHVHSSNEGLCFYKDLHYPEYYNGLFIHYLNILADNNEVNPSSIFELESLDKFKDFYYNTKKEYIEYHIHKQGKVFLIRAVRFEDKSFEIIISDISKQEEINQFKQQMVSNITHELRTPITSISGFLETVIYKKMPSEIQQYFLMQAFNQTKILTALIQDIGIINKIEEANHTFHKASLNLNLFLNKIKKDYEYTLQLNQIKLHIIIPDNVTINANYNLLSSVFKNLIDNTITHAGNGIDIYINMYNEDSENVYFNFYDTGKGINDEKHLLRLFERFYRIDEGRTRDNGGSGLGLSIVKNAINIHGGSIIVKKRKENGLEFIFHLKKK